MVFTALAAYDRGLFIITLPVGFSDENTSFIKHEIVSKQIVSRRTISVSLERAAMRCSCKPLHNLSTDVAGSVVKHLSFPK